MPFQTIVVDDFSKYNTPAYLWTSENILRRILKHTKLLNAPLPTPHKHPYGGYTVLYSVTVTDVLWYVRFVFFVQGVHCSQQCRYYTIGMVPCLHGVHHYYVEW